MVHRIRASAALLTPEVPLDGETISPQLGVLPGQEQPDGKKHPSFRYASCRQNRYQSALDPPTGLKVSHVVLQPPSTIW